MNCFSKLLTTSILLLAGSITVSAQRYSNNPYSGSYKNLESRSFGTFYAEYNPHVWHRTDYGSTTNTNFNGISVGFNYFVPVFGQLGFDAGVKGQYLFRHETEGLSTFKDNMFSASIPIDILYDFRVTEGFAIDPYVGLYGRYNFSAKNIEEVGGGRNTQNLFDKEQARYYGYETLDRFQYGWQVGVNFRISNVVTIGGAYWADLNDIGEDTNLHGFNILLGANF